MGFVTLMNTQIVAGFTVTPLLVVLAFAAGWLILRRTPLGLRVYAVGGDPRMLRQAGVDEGNLRHVFLLAMGLFTALGMIVMLGRLGAAAPTAGFGLELDAIVAVILGGASFRGGTGSVRETAIGVVFLAILNNGLSGPADGRRSILPDQGQHHPRGAHAPRGGARCISRGARRHERPDGPRSRKTARWTFQARDPSHEDQEARDVPRQCLERNYLFVRLTTDSGLTGIGEATLQWQEKAVEVLLNERVASRIIGKDCFDIEAVVGGNDSRDQYQGGSTVMTAISSVEIAMWDLIGKATGQPVYRLIGGRAKPALSAYANGWYGGCETPGDFAARAKQVTALGYRALKFDPFRTAWKQLAPDEEDHAVAVVEAVAGAVGPDVGLMVEILRPARRSSPRRPLHRPAHRPPHRLVRGAGGAGERRAAPRGQGAHAPPDLVRRAALYPRRLRPPDQSALLTWCRWMSPIAAASRSRRRSRRWRRRRTSASRRTARSVPWRLPRPSMSRGRRRTC